MLLLLLRVLVLHVLLVLLASLMLLSLQPPSLLTLTLPHVAMVTPMPTPTPPLVAKTLWADALATKSLLQLLCSFL